MPPGLRPTGRRLRPAPDIRSRLTIRANLRGNVDKPASGSTVDRGRITLQGWCVWGDQPALAVEAHVNGLLVGQAVTGTDDRRDVGRALGDPNLAKAGWCMIADLSWIVDQDAVDLVVTVWAEPGVPPVRLGSIALRLRDTVGAVDRSSPQDEFVGALDLPVAGGPIGPDVVKVAGWLLNPTAPTASVDIVIDGHHAGRARLGMERPEITDLFPVPHGPISGFEHLVDLAELPSLASPATIQVVARTVEGKEQVVLERTASVAPAHSPQPGPGRDELLQDRLWALLAEVDRRTTTDLNLVVFTHQLGLGGAQLWLSELLVRSGAGTSFPCTVISLADGPLRGLLEENGVTVHVTTAPPVDDATYYESRLVELSMLVAAGGHNVALVNTVISWIGADVTTRLGLPTVWAIHESLSPSAYWALVDPAGQGDPAVRWSFDRALKASSALVFEAEATRRLYAPGAGPGRTVVIPYGIDTEAIERYRKRVSRTAARSLDRLSSDRKVLLVMGTTEPRKAQTRLLEAFALVAPDHPDWMLVFVGATGSPYAQELKRYIKRVGLEGQTLVVPVVADTYAWYRAADVLVSASDMESLPRSVLEAMCFGVPVLATAVFGLGELITDGENGFLFEPSDLVAATDALRRVLAMSADDRTAAGKAGRLHILEHYDASGYAADVVALLRGLLDDPTVVPSSILSDGGRRSAAHASLGIEARAHASLGIEAR
jgi:D-inositol-3-phosphate glycosyltransferase